MDFYAEPPGTAIEHARQFFACLGGSAGNIAVALSRQGSASALISAVSDDAVGAFVRTQLNQYGVACDYLQTVSGAARTALAVAESRLEHYQAVLYRNQAADLQLSPEAVVEIPYADYGGLIITGTALAAEPSASAVWQAIRSAKAAAVTVILDLDYRPYSWTSAAHAASTYYQAALLSDVVIGNDEEFAVLAGSVQNGLDCARQLVTQNTTLVVYKMGAHGALTLTAEQTIRTGIYPVQALKPAGSGDAFMGSLMAALARGLTLEQCVLRGSAAAAMVVAQKGCASAMPNWQELDKFMGQHSDPIQTDSE